MIFKFKYVLLAMSCLFIFLPSSASSLSGDFCTIEFAEFLKNFGRGAVDVMPIACAQFGVIEIGGVYFNKYWESYKREQREKISAASAALVVNRQRFAEIEEQEKRDDAGYWLTRADLGTPETNRYIGSFLFDPGLGQEKRVLEEERVNEEKKIEVANEKLRNVALIRVQKSIKQGVDLVVKSGVPVCLFYGGFTAVNAMFSGQTNLPFPGGIECKMALGSLMGTVILGGGALGGRLGL